VIVFLAVLVELGLVTDGRTDAHRVTAKTGRRFASAAKGQYIATQIHLTKFQWHT